MSQHAEGSWDARFAQAGYLFGTEPNAFLVRQSRNIAPGGHVLSVADGEGRNGVWLAQQGYCVHTVEASQVAIEKARALARERGIPLASEKPIAPGRILIEQTDVLTWDWPTREYDAVVAIFIQFASPTQRPQLFANMLAAVKPGGVVLLEGYQLRQLAYGTGGPPVLDHLYDVELLRTSFSTTEIISLQDYDQAIDEGDGHKGMSALVDLVARKPLLPDVGQGG